MKSYNDIYNPLNDFRQAINDVQSLYNQCEDEITETDSVLCDLMHYCELSYPKTRAERTKICQMLRDNRIKRRKAKDTLMVIEPIKTFLANNKNFINDIGRVTNEARKAKQKIEGNRVYVPRVLNELFKGASKCE